MTKAEKKFYLKHNASRCPKCGGDYPDNGGITKISANEIRQEKWCNECGQTWTDVFKLDRAIG